MNTRINPQAAKRVRNADILWLISCGKTNDEIAQILNLSRRSVIRRREALMDLLGAYDKALLVSRAWEEGIIERVPHQPATVPHYLERTAA